MESKQLQEEKNKLEYIIEKYRDVMEYYDLRLEAIPKLYRNNPTMLENLLNSYTEKLNLMKKNISKPYFARIDFARDGESKVEKLYIGKVGVMDEENNHITIDWRAPVSSMYYDSNIGRTSYQAPEGICSGELLVKRQYEIEEGELKHYQDVDTVSNDELLKPYLETNVDNRLKNIVSTIQAEQNTIIRESIFKNIIVQGVAGSGKTTVALHRIAYLVYNNRDSIKPEQYLVIGPNKFFVNYISGVLPDLDVNHVKQWTYEELCADFLQEDIQLINEEDKLIASISNEEVLTYEKFKVSMKFKEALDKFIKQLDENLIPHRGLQLKGYELIPREVISKIYKSLNNTTIYNSIQKKIEKTKILLIKYIEDNYDYIMINIKEQYEAKIQGIDKQRIDKELDIRNSVEKELKSNANTSLKKYFSKLIPNTRELYYQFLMSLDKNIFSEENFINVIQSYQNAENIKKKVVEFEDLSALLYLQCKVQGNNKYDKYKQVAIDEAQDYGEFSFYALKILLNKATFSIFGDLAQSIYQYRGIKDWKQVLDTTFEENCEMKYLLKSYRTTMEIMDEANYITKHIGLMSAKPVIRRGKPVSYIHYKDGKSQMEYILKLIKEYKDKEYISIAIICKDEREASLLNKNLRNKDIQIKNIIDSETEYKGGICTITGYLAKGLEFDAVIIPDASEGKYDSNREIDMKLLYVAMTRPLHELTVLYKERIVKPLQKEI